MIHARGISKSYGVVRALTDVDFEIGSGEIVAIVGENGSGKSTLAKILAGAVQADEGEIVLDGEPLALTRPRDALEAGIALVAQEVTAVPWMSVAENVLLSHLMRPVQRVSRRRLAAQARVVLNEVGIRCDPNLSYMSLKAGDRELVEVAKAIATKPRYLILDEATSRLGEADVERLFALVRRLRDRGVSTILITHRLREIVDLADRAVVLRDGRRVGDLEQSELDEERLSRMMVGRDLSDFFHKQTVDRGEPLLVLDELVADKATAPISLEVRAGEVVGLAGLVGCGRTELLETIGGIRRARSGRVLVDGEEIPPGNPKAALRGGIALVPEDRHAQGLVLAATIRENVAMPLWRPLAVVHQLWERRLGRQAIERFRIRASSADATVRSLSGGNQQKVVLARALIRQPRILLLDEPTRGIDVGAKEEVFQLIGELLKSGIGILLVSSDMTEILGLADRIVVLHERRAVGALERPDFTEERIAYLSAGGRAGAGAGAA
ncbi:MAG TPA: sugar ABC transporter ATP-binding protein [Gaiellaceae bacterium]|nr:sugar ABC transporter ATP-binding protein [Gaiellaceae bacterium]